VAIARALMLRPRIILGDEPVSNLDPVSARRILELLLAIHREENRITLLNLHDVRLAKAFSTRIADLSRSPRLPDGSREEANLAGMGSGEGAWVSVSRLSCDKMKKGRLVIR